MFISEQLIKYVLPNLNQHIWNLGKKKQNFVESRANLLHGYNHRVFITRQPPEVHTYMMNESKM